MFCIEKNSGVFSCSITVGILTIKKLCAVCLGDGSSCHIDTLGMENIQEHQALNRNNKYGISQVISGSEYVVRGESILVVTDRFLDSL